MLREFVTQSAAGSADLATAVMLAALVAFTVAFVWVYRKDRTVIYEKASRLPLDEAAHD